MQNALLEEKDVQILSIIKIRVAHANAVRKKSSYITTHFSEGRTIGGHHRVPPHCSSWARFLAWRSRRALCSATTLTLPESLLRLLPWQGHILFTPGTPSEPFITQRPTISHKGKTSENAWVQLLWDPKVWRQRMPFPRKTWGQTIAVLLNVYVMKPSHIRHLNKDDFTLTVMLPFCNTSATDCEFGFVTREGAVGSSHTSR